MVNDVTAKYTLTNIKHLMQLDLRFKILHITKDLGISLFLIIKWRDLTELVKRRISTADASIDEFSGFSSSRFMLNHNVISSAYFLHSKTSERLPVWFSLSTHWSVHFYTSCLLLDVSALLATNLLHEMPSFFWLLGKACSHQVNVSRFFFGKGSLQAHESCHVNNIQHLCQHDDPVDRHKVLSLCATVCCNHAT